MKVYTVIGRCSLCLLRKKSDLASSCGNESWLCFWQTESSWPFRNAGFSFRRATFNFAAYLSGYWKYFLQKNTTNSTFWCDRNEGHWLLGYLSCTGRGSNQLDGQPISVTARVESSRHSCKRPFGLTSHHISSECANMWKDRIARRLRQPRASQFQTVTSSTCMPGQYLQESFWREFVESVKDFKF